MQVITSHINADFDSLASMLAAKKIYPEARLVFSGSQEKNVRDFLKYSQSDFEFDRLKNVNILEIDHLILVDTKSSSRIGPFSCILQKPGLRVHIYDHHPSHPQDIHGELEVVREFGATTTIFVEIIEQKGIPLTQEEATILAMGIYEDTEMMTFTSTTPHDLKAAAYLLTCGADLNTVSDFISRSLDAQHISLLNELIESAKRYLINGVEVVITTATLDRYVGDLAILVHKLKDMENINVLFALISMAGKLLLIARSRLEAVDVASIAYEFGGGGHPTAASAVIKDMMLIEAQEVLLQVLREKIRYVRVAKDIMTSSIKSVSPDTTLEQANQVMTKFNVNLLPVLSENKVTGLLTRLVIEKGIYHGLGKEKVQDYMTREFSVVKPMTPFSRLEELMIEHKQKLLPVVDEEKSEIIGAITRSDLLRVYHEDLLKKPRFLTEDLGHNRTFYPKSMKNLIHEILPGKIQNLLVEAARAADELEYSVYVVGGFVRDLLLRNPNLDIDLVVEGDGIAFANNLAKKLDARVKAHKKFRTAVIVLPDGFKIDVATARIEYYEHPAATPVIEWSSIKHDLYRRDFTINALAVKLNGFDAYNLIDFFGGQRDIKERVIKILHNLSFVEDPTRVFRAIRFEQRFSFSIGQHTLTLMESAIKKNLYARLAGHRLYTELVQILKEKNPLKSLRRMAELDLLKFIHPKLTLQEKKDQLFKNILDVLAWYNLLFLDIQVEGWLTYLMGLFVDLEEDELKEATQYLVLAERHRHKLSKSRNQIRDTLAALNTKEELLPSEIYGINRSIPVEALLLLMAQTDEPKIRKYVSQYLARYRSVNPTLSGEELKSLGYVPGPVFREILDKLRNGWLDGWIKSGEDELNYIKKHFPVGLSPISFYDLRRQAKEKESGK